VIAMVKDAYASGNFESASNAFEVENEVFVRLINPHQAPAALRRPPRASVPCPGRCAPAC
jgi:hypothetical protein